MFEPHGEKLTDTMRDSLVTLSRAGEFAKGLLDKLSTERDATTRAGHLVTLQELIGDKPPHSWETEWVGMVCEFHRTTGQQVDEHAPPVESMSEKELEEYVSRHLSYEQWRAKVTNQQFIESTIEFGWERTRAELFVSLTYVKSSIARALREGDKCYAASTYALCDVFFDQQTAARPQQSSRDLHRDRNASSASPSPARPSLLSTRQELDASGRQSLLSTSGRQSLLSTRLELDASGRQSLPPLSARAGSSSEGGSSSAAEGPLPPPPADGVPDDSSSGPQPPGSPTRQLTGRWGKLIASYSSKAEESMTSRGRLINATVKESLAPKLYTHLTGRSSLSSNEPNWEYILIPDQVGTSRQQAVGRTA